MKEMNLNDLNDSTQMKCFFKACLYEKLDDYNNADAMRYLFINIIYNGFQNENKYPENWTLDLIDNTKKIIKNGIKEKDKRNNIMTFFILNKFISNLHRMWIVNEKKSENYYDKIKAKAEYKYLVISEDAPFSGSYLLGDSKEDKKGPYFTPLKSTFGDNSKEKLSDNLLSEDVLFFDLLTIPLPISSDLRKKWSTEKAFNFDNKPLPVFLLEIAFEHYSLNEKIDNAKIAIMMPTKTSACIYNYFEKIKANDSLFCLKDKLTIKSCWQEINNYHEKIIIEGKCFNYYKSNTISGSNTPDADLLKYALSK
jgi:hypothetical protein